MSEKQSVYSRWKDQARDLLAGKWPVAVAVSFFRVLAEFILIEFLDLFVPASDSGFSFFSRIICSLIILTFSEVLAVGVRKVFLGFSASEPFLFQDLFFGFTHMPDRILWWALLMAGIDTAVISCPLFFLQRLLRSPGVSSAGLLAAAVLASVILVVVVQYRYVLVPYLYLAAPEQPVFRLFRGSARQMHGRKLVFFFLQISFVGLWLLGILSLGIGLLWLTPYRIMTEVLFWKQISGEKGAEPVR